MKVNCRGIARIKDSATGAIHEVESDELDWCDECIDERDMGMEVRHEATIEHPDLGVLTWSVWEYPLGCQNHTQTDVGEHELINDFDYGLEHEFDWEDYELPDNPFTIFMSSYHRTGDLLADHGGDDGGDLLNRMIFAHQIAALEAYLGDTLMKGIVADKEAMIRLITKDAELAKRRFSLADFAEQPELINTSIAEYLRSILYHNLEKVDFLYSAAFQFRPLDLVQDRKELFKAIKLRHDCVHRNGFDKDGKQLTDFTKKYVQETSDLIKVFVEKIDKKLREQLPF